MNTGQFVDICEGRIGGERFGPFAIRATGSWRVAALLDSQHLLHQLRLGDQFCAQSAVLCHLCHSRSSICSSICSIERTSDSTSSGELDADADNVVDSALLGSCSASHVCRSAWLGICQLGLSGSQARVCSTSAVDGSSAPVIGEVLAPEANHWRMALRSYVWPSAVMTGSCRWSDQLGGGSRIEGRKSPQRVH